jgi:hypothetical protein
MQTMLWSQYYLFFATGGKAGAAAAVVQVCSLMWLRTSMNYQYRYGGTLGESLKTLYADGGVPRL